ncbi:hypothetical protein P8452_77180 [Trifolium repens]|nr:hypothetical protein P8452_36122 [Trifolium repens]WJX95916.1 hypothetical protein P8452_77180 [Trifolium repens]
MEDDSSDQDDDDYSCLAEWQLIQKRLKRVDVSMKCEIRNQLRELAFPESTSLKAPKDKAISKEHFCRAFGKANEGCEEEDHHGSRIKQR